jgi:hypothetical protein
MVGNYQNGILLILTGMMVFFFVLFIGSIAGVTDCGSSCKGFFLGLVSVVFDNPYTAELLRSAFFS